MEEKLEIMKSDKTNPSSSRNVAIEKNSAQRNSNAREQTRQDVLVYVGSEKYNAYHAKTKRESSSSSNDIVSMDVFIPGFGDNSDDDQGRRSIPNSGGMDSKLGMYVCVLL